MTASKTPWPHFASGYDRFAPPLTPSEQDVKAIREVIRGHDQRVVMLGVTPALSQLGETLTAFDNAPKMVKTVWPGDRIDRRAHVADWLALPLETATATAVIGDAPLNAVGSTLPQLLAEIRRVLREDGVVATRAFCAPATPETLAEIQQDVASGGGGNVHAVKWRIAMALAHRADGFTVPVTDIRNAFYALWPTIDSFCALTGWPRDQVETIDFYAGASHSLCFPTEQALRTMAAPLFAAVSFQPPEGYLLSERCPLCVLRP